MLTAPHRPSRRIDDICRGSDRAYYTLRSEYGLLRLDTLPRDIVRVRFTRRESFVSEHSPFIVNRDSAPFDSCELDQSDIRLENASLAL